MNISRLGRSLSATAILSVAALAQADAQATPRTDAATHTVKRRDTLWDIAKTYLGDPYLWPEIYRINTDQIEDPHWIYPGEVLRLPGKTVAAAPAPAAPAPMAATEPVTRAPGLSVFNSQVRVRNGQGSGFSRPRVSTDEMIRAPFYSQVGGPDGYGKVLFGADLPGIDKEHNTSNLQLFDRVLVVPPRGSAANVHDRLIAYREGETYEGVGTMVVPVALLEVVRSPRNGEPAIMEIRALYNVLDADTKVLAIDTTGMNTLGAPVPVSSGTMRIAELTNLYTDAVLPSLNSYVLFDLSAHDGIRVGDEVEIFRARQEQYAAEGPILPEVSIARAQVVRVTPFGATARVTSQQQPAIRTGESIRVIARMR